MEEKGLAKERDLLSVNLKNVENSEQRGTVHKRWWERVLVKGLIVLATAIDLFLLCLFI